MTRKIAILMIAMLVALTPAMAKKKQKGGTPVPQFTEKVYDFGSIKEAKGPVSHEFEFVNAGDANLVVIDATAQCGCTRPEYPQNPIAPGKKSKVKVTYNPLGRPGSFEKTVTVKTNGKPARVTLKIKGSVIPK